MINILVAENSQLLQSKLHDCIPQNKVITSTNDNNNLIDVFEQVKPDFAFFDLEVTKISTLNMLKDTIHRCDTVITSNDNQYFAKAYQAGAIDYIQKPYSEARLQECISRLTNRLSSVTQNYQAPIIKEKLKRINIQLGKKIWLINIKDIISFKAYGRYIKVQTKKREGLLRMTLKQLKENLDPENFWQIHRSTIINLDYLEHVQISNDEKMLAQMAHLSIPHTISRSYTHLFKSS